MGRMVVLGSDRPVLEAARALESNRIGAVVVQDQGRVVGILTDRDLATRVVARALDPRQTRIGEVMSSSLLTASPSDRQDDAIRLMRQRNVRRIPLVEDGRLVGIVTLDDLVLDEAASLDQLAGVIEAQIGEGGPAPSAGSAAARRRGARAQATYGRLLNQVRADAGVLSAEEAETALLVVLGSIVMRIMPGEAEDFIAQLPSLLQPMLRALPPGPDKLITRETMEEELRAQLGVDAARAAEIARSVGAIIAQMVSPGEILEVQNQLPVEMRSLLGGGAAPLVAASAAPAGHPPAG
jgi:uncharacterized protein (DUF2267 family)/predicted transcriptional regulator